MFAVVVACGFRRQQKKFTNVRKLVQLCIYQCACKSNRLKNNICTARNTIQFRRIWANAFVNYYHGLFLSAERLKTNTPDAAK